MVLGWFWDGLGMILAEKEGREEGTLLRVGREDFDPDERFSPKTRETHRKRGFRPGWTIFAQNTGNA